MTLNLYTILREVLNEVVNGQDVVDAIDNKQVVIINYSDEKNRAPKKRIIEPYDYGVTTAGNEVLRAYQYKGDTYRGIPKWKLFRLDRIQTWKPTSTTFHAEPNKRGWRAEDYNENGDNSLVQVYHQVKFGNEKYHNLDDLRKQNQLNKDYAPANLNDLDDTTPQTPKPTTPNNSGPIDPPSTSKDTNQGPLENPFVKKDDNYWSAYDAAEKEMKQNDTNPRNMRRRDNRWQNAADNRRLWRKNALNDFDDE